MKYCLQFINFVFIFCSIQYGTAQHLKSIQGTWVDSKDKYSIVKIDKKNYYDIYKGDTVVS
jgi:hypothetical protein